MTPNVNAMLLTIDNFLKLATPAERREFLTSCGLRLHIEEIRTNAETSSCTAGDSGVVLDLRTLAAKRGD
jgi:hypothetical protein